MTPGIKPLVAGNWKMNGLQSAMVELSAMATGLSAGLNEHLDMLICPPATLLHLSVEKVAVSGVLIGAQDCHASESGAHTGDISAEMVADAGAKAVIVGHSERRTDHGESNETIRSKAEAGLRAGLLTIVCIGETEEERKSGKTLDVLKDQLDNSLPDSSTAEKVVVAYEPVWAIGTGLVPLADDVADAHAFIRENVSKRFGNQGDKMRLLYGGSVKPGNAAELMGVSHVDGALVGGASLKAEDFLGICAAYESLS